MYGKQEAIYSGPKHGTFWVTDCPSFPLATNGWLCPTPLWEGRRSKSLSLSPSTLVKPIGIVDNLGAPSAPAADPEARVEVLVPIVARLELDRHSELVPAGGDVVGRDRVLHSLHHVPVSGPPALDLAYDGGRVLVVGLDQVLGRDLRRHVSDRRLGVLASGL